jgi:hypothetical protein
MSVTCNLILDSRRHEFVYIVYLFSISSLSAVYRVAAPHFRLMLGRRRRNPSDFILSLTFQAAGFVCGTLCGLFRRSTGIFAVLLNRLGNIRLDLVGFLRGFFQIGLLSLNGLSLGTVSLVLVRWMVQVCLHCPPLLPENMLPILPAPAPNAPPANCIVLPTLSPTPWTSACHSFTKCSDGISKCVNHTFQSTSHCTTKGGDGVLSVR